MLSGTRSVSTSSAFIWKSVEAVKLASHTFVALNKSSVGRSRLPHLLALLGPTFSASTAAHPHVKKTRLSRETARWLERRSHDV